MGGRKTKIQVAGDPAQEVFKFGRSEHCNTYKQWTEENKSFEVLEDALTRRIFQGFKACYFAKRFYSDIYGDICGDIKNRDRQKVRNNTVKFIP